MPTAVPSVKIGASASFAMLALFAIVGVACGAFLPVGVALVVAFIAFVVITVIIGGVLLKALTGGQ